MEADRLGVFHGAVHISGFKLQVAPNYPAYFALNGVVKPSVVRSKVALRVRCVEGFERDTVAIHGRRLKQVTSYVISGEVVRQARAGCAPL